MVELRKRKAPFAEPAAPPPLKKNGSSNSKAKTTVLEEKTAVSKVASSRAKIAVGDNIDVDDFGGEIETNDGEKTTLKKILHESNEGVVIFTYPKASTPGCTTQACLFRDDYTSLTATGYSIFGLSTDSPKSNTTFKTKQNLPYVLLCDPGAKLIGAIGMKKTPKGTLRGVVAINKQAQVELTFTGGPAATVDEVRKLMNDQTATVTEATEDVAEGTKDIEDGPIKPLESTIPGQSPSNGDIASAEVAAEVADSAEKLDQENRFSTYVK